MAQVKVGDVGIDSSGAHLNPVSIHQNGGRFRIRYSAGVGNSQPATQFKLCGPSEIGEAAAADVDFIANSEWYTTRITEGFAAGLADGAADLKFWRSRGLARGASIYVSWDANPSRLKWPKALAYLKGYDKGLKGYYAVDCYAGTPFLRYALAKGVIRHGWRPNAGSWSRDGLPYQPPMNRGVAKLLGLARAKTPAAIWQTGNYWYGKQADENVILRVPVGSHGDALAAAAAPKPPATPTPVPPSSTPGGVPAGPITNGDRPLILYVDRADCAKAATRWPGEFLLDGGRLTHIPEPSDVRALRKAGVRRVKVSLAFYRALGGK